MTTRNATGHVRMVVPKITIAMMICGIVSAAGVGAASAAAQDDGVPALKVKFDPQSLTTEQGARQLYRRLRNAASEVCPDYASEGRLFSVAVLECRKQALARAVMKINNPRLVAVYQSSMKNG
jgi:UrcA family protein